MFFVRMLLSFVFFWKILITGMSITWDLLYCLCINQYSKTNALFMPYTNITNNSQQYKWAIGLCFITNQPLNFLRWFRFRSFSLRFHVFIRLMPINFVYRVVIGLVISFARSKLAEARHLLSPLLPAWDWQVSVVKGHEQ